VNSKLPDHLLYESKINPHELGDWLTITNTLTRSILQNLEPGQELVPKDDVLNPPYWEFGHLTWFHEFWVHRHGQETMPSLISNSDYLFNSSDVAHTDRWSLEMPSLNDLLDYNKKVFEKTQDLLKNSSDAETAYFIKLSIFHQDMHNEAFAYMWQRLGYREPFVAFSKTLSNQQASHYINFPKSTIRLGSESQNTFIFDNEKWAHVVEVPAFSVSDRAVSNTEYLEFIESEANRADLNPVDFPKHWKKQGDVLYERFFDQWLAFDDLKPVRHISFIDAQRYCDWRGIRLPTEQELSILMNHPQDQWQASDLWEWTSSPFMPFPGFSQDPYLDYSKPWFDGGYQVLKGWSLYTPERMRRTAFRNFYAPNRNDHFCGFRTCLL
jgi:ergothioneine biosynthesis protein EgtB